ncbi:DUF1624 domain-containing protein [Silvibacterium sp.]|uniref:DUF1624 domain-containing protein n=1 Tax=Silvibacterium sp. TaxID=1964179 RepID=UPI0039E2BA3A
MNTLPVAEALLPVTKSSRSYRIESLDTLRGLLMLLMAIDHTRDYFSSAAIDPADPVHSWPALFFTRWITHLCAPGFILLAGASVYLQRKRKSAAAVTKTLVLRGLWLILLEITVVSFGWSFGFGLPILQVIWVIGISMIALAGLQWLPLPALALFAIAVIFGHDLMDGVHASSLGAWRDTWLVLHERGVLTFHRSPFAIFGYPVIPWVGVMALGYCFGAVIDRSPQLRQRLSFGIGAVSFVTFLILRDLHGYGDPGPRFPHLATTSHRLMALLSVQKYPPSLHYLLATLGIVWMLFAFFDRVSARSRVPRVRRFLDVYGRVPFFFYVLHIYVIHGLALLIALAITPDWRYWITPDVVFTSHFNGWGFGLPTVYLIWLAVVLALYPLCSWFSSYKDRNRSWWLSYL